MAGAYPHGVPRSRAIRPWWHADRVPPPLVLMDSASLYFRSYFALPESITAPDGTPVNAARGFLDTVARIITDRGPARLVACLDADWRAALPGGPLPPCKDPP